MKDNMIEKPKGQVVVVQRVDNAIHQINRYPVDSVVCFVNAYLLDSDLSGGYTLSILRTTGARRQTSWLF